MDCPVRPYRQNHQPAAARAAALNRARHRCEICGARSGLHVHHWPPVGPDRHRTSCAHHQTNLTVLCQPCHHDVHRALRTDTPWQQPLFRAA